MSREISKIITVKRDLNFKEQQMIITISFEIKEKGEELKIVPKTQIPIQYNPIDITRKYYKKTDKEYHRKPIKRALKTLISDRIVKQEPLLDFH